MRGALCACCAVLVGAAAGYGSSSVEGKKVQEIDRVLGPHSFEVFRREGSGAWLHEMCPALASGDTSDPRFAGCSQV